MTKKELLEAMAGEAGISQADADKALGALVSAVTAAVAKGDRVAIPGLGTFERRERSARTGRNPQTGEEIQIAATSAPVSSRPPSSRRPSPASDTRPHSSNARSLGCGRSWFRASAQSARRRFKGHASGVGTRQDYALVTNCSLR